MQSGYASATCFTQRFPIALMLQPYPLPNSWNFFLKQLIIHEEVIPYPSRTHFPLLYKAVAYSLSLHSHSHKDIEEGTPIVLFLPEGI